MLTHLAGYDVVLVFYWPSTHNINHGLARRHSIRCTEIKSQVNPKKLNWLEWRFLAHDCTSKSYDARTDIDGDLELEVALNVFPHVPSPLASFLYASETVVSNKNIRSLLAHVSSRHTHSKTNSSFFYSR